MNLDSIGPSDDPKKYKIIKKVGEESVYGNVYKSERVSDGNNPRYIEEKFLNVMIEKAKELSKEYKIFGPYIYRLEYLKNIIQ